ncbi:hypothetical protein OF117_00460 [Geodermatophilus sp. YIM 151500]|uniref:hypothetical protein n=1 Tax=Geodermatophilus sp. YIM 151500 TaxID=2984531 RepID=UPI0021E36DFC|nr:hypothetical protein [Geodermatophilus sp. YIM 151500]MCV2487818.1 hypothetical protein [Geodermatophilus sp. YIM 151500]
MARCLVVANQTLGGKALVEAVQRRVNKGLATFYVVVPATPLHDQALAEDLGAGPSPEERAYALARQRLDRALTRLRDLGAVVDGEVGDADALEATRQALNRFSADEVLVSTLPLGVSRWLRIDLPSRIARTCGLPVDHVISEPVSQR